MRLASTYRGAKRNAPRKARAAALAFKRALKAKLGLGRHAKLTREQIASLGTDR